MNLKIGLLIAFVAAGASASPYKAAPGAPGNLMSWTRPDKDAVGTTLHRPLWFTTVRGSLTEIAFPYVDRVQTRDSYLVIRSSSGVYDERIDESIEYKRLPQSLAYQSSRSGSDYNINKMIYAHPAQNSIIIDYEIESFVDGEKEIIFLHNPTAEQTPGGDEIIVENDSSRPTIYAFQRDLRGDEPNFLSPIVHHSLTWSLEGSKGSAGFFGVNSPADQIQKGEGLLDFTQASYGNVAGALHTVTKDKKINFRVVISFTTVSDWKVQLSNMNLNALKSDGAEMIRWQRAEWQSYLTPLMYDRRDPLSESSILILKSGEDKTNRGAIIAAPANPSIPWHVEAPEHPYEDARKKWGDANAGYRRVWPRDLYHKATAFLAIGDYATAVDIAKWFRKVQLRGFRDGSWAQNMWSDGTPSWNAFQIDQTGFPIVLVKRLVDLKQINYSEFREMVVRAANFVVIAGPNTDQERWEENGGLSPNSLAAAVEGLLSAAVLEAQYGDFELGKRYRDVAYYWYSKFKDWTLIRNGKYGANYFPRLEIGFNGQWRPDRNDEYYIHNKADNMQNRFREDEVLDGGFLQWILAGLVDPHDQDFTRTIQLLDEHVRKDTPYGKGYLRYNFDAYGENHVGGLWPLLSAERAIAAIERKENYQEHLSLIRNIATPAGLIGEQDTLAVRPLAWSHGAYLILLRSERDGRSFYRSLNSSH